MDFTMAKDTVAARANSTVEKATPVQRLINILEIEAQQTDGLSGKEIGAQIVGNMFEAESLEAAFAMQDNGLANGKDMVDIELEVRGFDVVKSDEQYRDSSPLGYYVRVNDVIRLDTLAECPFATGAPNVVGLLWKARNSDRLPLQCVIKSKATANGELLTLKLIPKRSIVGEVAA